MKKILVKLKKNGKYVKSRIILKKEVIDEQHLHNLNQMNLDTSINMVSSKILDDNSQNISFLEEKKNKIVHDILQRTDMMKTDDNVVMVNSESLRNILENNAITIRWCKLCNLIVNKLLNMFLVK